MPTIADLFKDKEKDLYENEIVRIESRGLVNPPRAAALLASSPNTVADLIGGQVAGTIGGSANRPSDTIYKDKGVINKPVSLKGVTTGLLQSSVEAGTNYYVKREPSSIPGIGPVPPLFGKSAPGGSTTAGTIANQAIKAINKLGGGKEFKSAAQKLKADKNSLVYGPVDGKPVADTITNTKYRDKYTSLTNKRTDRVEYVSEELVKREGNYKWDDGNAFLLKKPAFKDKKEYEDQFVAKYGDTNQVPVLFKRYGNSNIIPFVGAVSGISEDVTPEWQGFQYVGSPFKNYRYQGVERSLKFSLKLYYFTANEKSAMIQKINYLKSLAFPYDTVSQIKVGSDVAQYAFSPNLVYVTIGDLYKNMFGYIESLSFSIQDGVTWANFVNEESKDKTSYPSVIDVSIGLKIIENHSSDKSDAGTVTYRYNFDGRGDEFIEETRESNSTAATTNANGEAQNTSTTPSDKPAASSPNKQFESGQLNEYTTGYQNMNQ
jgi:hypothetical protein